MGLFDKAKASLGFEDSKLLASGTLARGNVISVRPTGVSVGGSDNRALGTEVVCDVTVEVVPLDGSDSYEAICRHAIPQVYLPKLQEEGAAVAVRVDPKDPGRIELDLAHEVPPAPIVLVGDDGSSQVLKTNTAPVTAADILREGSACSVVVLAVIPLNQNDQSGQPATGLVLEVHRDGAAPYQAQIGIHIPDVVASRVVVGATLPARFVPGTGQPADVNLVTPDWASF